MSAARRSGPGCRWAGRLVLAAGLAGAAVAVAGDAKPALPTAYPAEWDVTFTQRAPLKVGEGFCQPPVGPGVSSGLCYGKYLGFDPKKITYAKGTRLFAASRPLDCDIQMDQDVAITLRDGVKIYADVLRPAGQDKLPAIIAWGPYTKSLPQDPEWVYPKEMGVDPGWLTGLAKFEAPDAGYWACHGYTVVNVDPRGVDVSEGDMQFFGRVDAADGYEVVEWVAAQPWSNGKVGIHGSSWLAMVQFHIAALRPPHLAAIAPASAHITDLYRHRLMKGGIPNTRLNTVLTRSMRGSNRYEEPSVMASRQPLMNAYWEDKIADMSKVEVPMYLVGSYGLEVQAAEMDGFFRAASRNKWLRITDKGTWADQYMPENVDDTRRFFDRYLKGVDNGWEQTPRVRLAVLDPGGEDRVNVPASDWPLANTQYRKIYLDAANGTLSPRPVGPASSASYDARTGKRTFVYRFDRDTAVVGYLRLRLWVEVADADDGDFFVTVQKTGADGKVIEAARGYKGTGGRLRASMRALDAGQSTDFLPVPSFRKRELLGAGQVVPLDISISPTGMMWRAGQELRLTVAGDVLKGTTAPANAGRHVIHAGGKYDAYLQIPVVALGDR
ncbi:MAG: CocE/NonD family hydrolase [Alcaligenaceae bacterium]|nr:CocE/NonD family hydrolase [Alcaligenaceae bacterium SAGV5]MPS53674.1 CocE/NonD family hydrolase [Alcaligenaceae bacterium SAGV3]MPT59255.1 CocE/NonD family hydrolase [Alcaligenaceae bacterium]